MSTTDYRNEIDRLITESSGEIILNGSLDHAAIIIERMFARADRIVRILTRKFDPRIYCDEETVDSARHMLGDKERQIKILVEEMDATNHVESPYFTELKKYSNLEIREVPESLRASIGINFALMDERGFRLEKDQSGATAVVAFGEGALRPRLAPLFDKVWNLSKAVTC